MDFLQGTLNTGGHLQPKVKEIVANLYEYFSKVRDEKIAFSINISTNECELKGFIASLTNLSMSSIYKILNEKESNQVEVEESVHREGGYSSDEDADTEQGTKKRKMVLFNKPKKSGPRTKSKLDQIDDVTKCILI